MGTSRGSGASSGVAGTRVLVPRALHRHGQGCLLPLLKWPFSDFLEVSYSLPAPPPSPSAA